MDNCSNDIRKSGVRHHTHYSINVPGSHELLQNPVVVRRHGHHVVMHLGWMSGPREAGHSHRCWMC